MNKIPIHCAHDRSEDVEKLIPNPRNPNQHPEEQLRLFGKILQQNGWRRPIVVSKRSGFVVKGHGALLAAQLIGCRTVPVNYQDYANEALEHADMIADNRLAELSDPDNAELVKLIKELDGDIDLELTGFDQDALDALMPEVINASEDDFELPGDKELDELQKKWKTALGQLWTLGPHRILCGDSTKEADVSLVLKGHQPNLMVTDPPYGVEYDPNWRNEAERASGKKVGARAVGKVQNDDVADWTPTWRLFPGAVAYVWHAGKFASEVQTSLMAADFDVRSQIVWNKPRFVISRGDYHWKHEPCWYCVRKGKTSNWQGDRSQTTVWDIVHQKSDTGHGTQKPIECMLTPMLNNSRKGESVFEPFSGSGTTIMAAEQSGRIALAIELDPRYVAVALERYKATTGTKPKKS